MQNKQSERFDKTWTALLARQCCLSSIEVDDDSECVVVPPSPKSYPPQQQLVLLQVQLAHAEEAARMVHQVVEVEGSGL
jgi:hypothetical protein